MLSGQWTLRGGAFGQRWPLPGARPAQGHPIHKREAFVFLLKPEGFSYSEPSQVETCSFFISSSSNQRTVTFLLSV